VKKKIIVSGADKNISPWLAFMLSTAAAGLGQVYGGRAAKGAAFMLLRAIAVVSVPCYCLLNTGVNVASEIAIAAAVFAAISLFSPIEALASAIKNGGRIKVKSYNTVPYYALFAAASTLITILSLVIFFSCFSFFRSRAVFTPLVEPGDILIVNKTGRDYVRGEAVFDSSYNILRIIALPGETALFKNRILSVNGTALHRSVYSEEELNALRLTDNNVISEHNGHYRYAVIASTEKFTLEMNPAEGEYLVSTDERKDADSFTRLAPGAIAGSFEGILFSPSRTTLIILPQMNLDKPL